MGPSQCGCACAHTASATSLGRRFIDHTITWRVRDIHPLHVGWLVYRSRPQQAGRRAAAQLPATKSVAHTPRAKSELSARTYSRVRYQLTFGRLCTFLTRTFASRVPARRIHHTMG